MEFHTTKTNIQKFIETEIIGELKDWFSLLVEGKLYDYEIKLQEKFIRLSNYLGEELLPKASEATSCDQKKSLQELGCKRLEQREFRLRLSTGHEVKVDSYYAKEVPPGWSGSRHSIVGHWKIIGNASPGLYDRVGYASGIGPSYDIVQQSLRKFGTEICLSSVRDINNGLADHCFEKEEELIMGNDESLEGRRVILGMDGGRTRTRNYSGLTNPDGNSKFDTDWREPKLFVIDVLDGTGRPDPDLLPVYGCRFDKGDMFGLLSRYLKKVKVEKVASIQILADGAPWIWNHTKTILMDLGVDENKITETLDYYHASSYVHGLVTKMPKRIGEEKKKGLLKQFKELLWQGKSTEIVFECKKIYKRPNQIIRRWMNYLEKHNDKTQYTDYQEDNMMCGSGIIESAIRRVINLRFKNASTFWNEKIVEKLYFLRGALVSKRWDLLMNNLVT